MTASSTCRRARGGSDAYRTVGRRYVEKPTTLGQETEAWLAREYGARGEAAGDSEVQRARSAKVWSAFADVPVSALRRAEAEDFIAGRVREHRRSANNELEFLKRVLKDARARGQRVAEGVLSIAAIKHVPREGRALTVEQLYDLASWTAEHSKRLVLLAGMMGSGSASGSR
jgi:hypothetical protein